ncbi:hypothetical protein D3C78_1741980 [compost metagenome]
MKGLASGLSRIACISAPASDSAAPTSTAINAYGRRTFQMITRSVALSVVGSKMPCSKRPRLMPEAPLARSPSTDTSSNSASPATSNPRRHSSRR